MIMTVVLSYRVKMPLKPRPTFKEIAGLSKKAFFSDFPFPYGFYGVDEYQRWLAEAGLKARRVELIPKDMQHQGKDGFACWLRSTWLPYLSRVPVQMQAEFIEAILDVYLVKHPPDEEGLVHVDMVRLEVEAFKL